MKLKFKLPFPCEGRRHTKKQAPAVRKLPGLRYLLKTDDNHHLYHPSYKKIHHEKKQKLSKEAQEIAELYTRLEILIKVDDARTLAEYFQRNTLPS